MEGGWMRGDKLTAAERRKEAASSLLNHAAIALDPSFWQALGKALGWKAETYEDERLIPYTHEIRKIRIHKSGALLTPPWKIKS